MKQSLRFFSLGILVSALLLLGYTLFFEDATNKAELSVEEMTNALSEEGYRVVSEDEFITYTLEKDKEKNAAKDEKSADKVDKKDSKKKADKNKKADKAEKKDEKKKEADEVVKGSIKTESGVVSQDIADDLVEKKIIKKDDRNKFVKYLDDNDYSKYIQLGTFKVSSDMDFKELAETVTTYPGN